jgi:hypothetical protein
VDRRRPSAGRATTQMFKSNRIYDINDVTAPNAARAVCLARHWGVRDSRRQARATSPLRGRCDPLLRVGDAFDLDAARLDALLEGQCQLQHPVPMRGADLVEIEERRHGE